jgi:subtilisin-like proprotein convertase family protein
MNLKVRFLAIFFVLLSVKVTEAQLAYSPFVDSIIQLSDHQSILLLTRQLAGDTTVNIDGEIITIQSRHYQSTGNTKAAQFIYNKFEEYGYHPQFQSFNGLRGANVIAEKTGIRYPEKQYIICGHYDNMPSGSTAPGADDNASGTVAVLEAARILSNIDSDYTIIFAAWDEEEIGLVGSDVYAQNAFNNGDQILGVLNLDMIAWDSDNDNLFSVSTNNTSTNFTNDFILTNSYYQPQLTNNFINTTASDHASFWTYGYPAFLVIEDWYDFNEYYHTPQDDISILNMDYYVALVRAAIANITANALNQRMSFIHTPVVSGNSIDEREAELTILTDHAIGTGDNSPRLWYSVDEENFNYVLPYESVDKTYKFRIPGFPIGTTIYYYFGVQDSAARMIATYPTGGRGINPPGTTQPELLLSYQVDHILFNQECSATTPKAIIDNSNTYDYITIEETGALVDLDVSIDITHSSVGELRLILLSPDKGTSILSDRNGGNGDNYTQTIFDEQALTSITTASPPFTGRFRPQMSFDGFLNKPATGQWELRIYESGVPNAGTLNDWCLHFLYRDDNVNTDDIAAIDKVVLLQNFPNPASENTKIKFRLDEEEELSLIIYDVNGREVRNLASGKYQPADHLIWTSVSDLRPGIYHYTLKTNHSTLTRQMVVIR